MQHLLALIFIFTVFKYLFATCVAVEVYSSGYMKV